ncbi:MC family mitochondrial carrier protein [Periconia macrospinosa]|uniref:MC family mitochondrial carrier protein n=1 Tax=Periconia macrospinosa TaxID=97972 RepID=A0A2V1E832_9PLEO|nr:MC family mitochondrial carrier protein [Periconia macrospinosa]
MSTNSGWNIWFAGAFAGISINLVFFPLDTLKTRLQSPQYQQLYRSQTAIANRALFRGLYQGVSTVTLIAVPSSVVFFSTYERLKRTLGSTQIPLPAVHAISSGAAQLLNCAVVTPAEVIKQNAQMLGQDDRKGRGGSPTIKVMKLLIKHPAGLWRGYTALAARDLPFTALQFPVFEYLKRTLTARRSRKKGGEPVTGVFERARISAASAGVAGCAAAWVTTPFDVVKTRMMLGAGAKSKDQHPARGSEANGLQIFKSVLRDEGVKGLFRGGLIRAGWTIIGNGLYMGCYEGARFYLDDRGKDAREDELKQIM